jgi:hypothetical protein
MANRSGLLGLKRGLAAFFVAQDISASVRVGWTARSRQDNQGPGGASRVVLIPGDFDATTGAPRVQRAGRLDRDGPQNHVNLDPQLRALAWWHESVTCSVWGVDVERPKDEEAQIEATELLLEQTIQGLHNAVDPLTNTPAGFANLEDWGEPFWTLPPGEMAYGRELVFGFVLVVPLFDLPIDKGYPVPAVGRDPAA